MVRGMLGGKDLAWGYKALAKDPCLKNNSGVELSHLHEKWDRYLHNYSLFIRKVNLLKV